MALLINNWFPLYPITSGSNKKYIVKLLSKNVSYVIERYVTNKSQIADLKKVLSLKDKLKSKSYNMINK